LIILQQQSGNRKLGGIMTKRREKKLLDRACTELVEVSKTPPELNIIPSALKKPTSIGSSASSCCQKACGTSAKAPKQKLVE
jgi:hypothetical protein